MRKFGGLDQMTGKKLSIKSLDGLSDRECAERVAESFAAVSIEYSPLDQEKLPAFLPAGRPEQVNILYIIECTSYKSQPGYVFQVLERIKRVGKTKSTLPIDIPDKLRAE